MAFEGWLDLHAALEALCEQARVASGCATASPFFAVPSPDGGLQITAFRDGETEPVELHVAAASAPALLDAIDTTLAAQAAGRTESVGPIALGKDEVTVSATATGLRITVLR